MQLQQAHNIALQLIDHLQPHCTRIHIAGSIRRECLEVNDIEIILEPKCDTEYDLFNNPLRRVRSSNFVNAITQVGERLKGNVNDGRYLRLKVNNTIMEVDLFIPQAHDYYRMLAIRTGSYNYSHRTIAATWLKKGWCGTPDGLRLINECVGTPNGAKTDWKCVSKNPTLPPVWETEEAFFTWLGLPFLPPKKRFL